MKTEPNYAKEEKLLIKLLLIYCIGVTLCRFIGADMRYIAYMDWTIYRKDLLAILPYYLMPYIALVMLSLSRYGRNALFFTSSVALVGIIDHGYAAFISMRYALPFFQLTGREPPVRINVLIALILAICFAVLAWKIFRTSRHLHVQKTQNDQKKSIGNVLKTYLIVMLLIFCYFSPFVEYKEIVRLVTMLKQHTKPVKLLRAGSNILYITGSPDGKLLAIGAEKGLYVWDVKLQECIWSDDALRKVRRIRFSPSGKYIAAGGKGVPEGSSDIAVYEVDGFKRLPNVEMLEEDLTKEKLFHDIAFRPDEKSLLTAWHKDWDWQQIPGGYHGEEAKALRNEEKRPIPEYPKYSEVKKELFCTELNLEEYNMESSKMIKSLSTQYDLLLSGGIGFSPSASFLLYPKWRIHNNLVARNRLYLVDTRTWSEEEIMLDDKYSMFTGVGGVSIYSDWYEWKFTNDEKDIYLLGKEEDVDGIGRGMNTLAYLFLKLDLETKEMQEILRIPRTAEIRTSAWIRIALSQDEEKVLLLSLGDPYICFRSLKVG